MSCSVHGDDADTFSPRIKVCSSKLSLPSTIHQRGRVQEHYYPTDDENSDEDDSTACEETVSALTNGSCIVANVQ